MHAWFKIVTLNTGVTFTEHKVQPTEKKNCMIRVNCLVFSFSVIVNQNDRYNCVFVSESIDLSISICGSIGFA